MLYALTTSSHSLFKNSKIIQGLIGQKHLDDHLPVFYDSIAYIQADGDELAKCCRILGRQLPDKKIYTFLGDNAREIAINW